MTDINQLSKQFWDVAESIKTKEGHDKLETLCREIIDHPSFKDYVALSRDQFDPELTLRTAFNSLSQNQTYQGLMAFIQTDGALAMAEGIRPEHLVDFLGETQNRMSEYNRETFNMFLWEMTAVGQALQENYPAARPKMMLAMK